MDKQFSVIILILIQLIFNAVLVSTELAKNLFSYTILGPGIAIPVNMLIAGISIFLISQSVDLIKKEQKLEELEKQNRFNEDLSTAIRTIKHDVANQILIIDGLYQLGKGKDSIAYSRKMMGKFDWMDKVLQLKNPEIVSLIINKINEANDHGIETSIELVDEESSFQEGALDKLTRIMSNLLDNAIYTLKTKPSEERILRLKISANLGFFQVENSGIIEEDVQRKIFDKGFTTKGNEGNGLGLFIVKSLTEELNGRLDFLCKDGKTRFTVKF